MRHVLAILCTLCAGLPAGAQDVSETRFVTVVTEGDALNVRTTPTRASRVIGRVRNGDVVFNQGCRDGPGRQWCEVRPIGATEELGWAAADFLLPATAETRASAGQFDRIGRLSCKLPTGSEVGSCPYGVAYGNGLTALVIYGAERTRWLFSWNGVALSYVTANGKEMLEPFPDGETLDVDLEGARFSVPLELISGM